MTNNYVLSAPKPETEFESIIHESTEETFFIMSMYSDYGLMSDEDKLIYGALIAMGDD